MRRVARGAFAAPALSSALSRLESGQDRSLATDLVYGSLRRRLFLDACLAPRLRSPGRLPEAVREALRLGAFEILVRGTPRHAAVNEWVELVKESEAHLAPLANAVLRRVGIPEGLPRHLRWSLPEWLAADFASLLGARAAPSALAMLEPEPLWLTAFAPGAAEALREEGCEVSGGPLPGSLAVRSPLPLGRLQAFREGLVQPQNPASRLPARALAARPGERVLDLAGGNGIKAAELAAAGAAVLSVDVDPAKLERAARNHRRLGVRVERLAADLRRPPEVEPAAKVLLDAPCSGTGTLRGNPEIKLRLSPAAVRQLADLQAQLLDSAAQLTAPAGVLVYSVCALTPAEGPEQIAAFLERHPAFAAEPPDLPLETVPAGAGRVLPPEGGLDGFFIAALRRRG